MYPFMFKPVPSDSLCLIAPSGKGLLFIGKEIFIIKLENNKSYILVDEYCVSLKAINIKVITDIELEETIKLVGGEN